MELAPCMHYGSRTLAHSCLWLVYRLAWPELRALSGTDTSLLADDEVVRMILPAVRGDHRAIETYVYEPGPLLRCAMTAFVGDEDPRVTIEEAQDWAGHTTAGFELCVFHGGHFYLTAHPGEPIAHIARVEACS